MGDTHHDRDAAADKLDGVLDQGLALFEAEIGVFLGFDPGGDHHGGAAVLDDVVDLTAKRGRVDLEIGREGRERRDDQSGIHHAILTPRSSLQGLRAAARAPSRLARCAGRM